jgi:DNA-directed RNA polymerase sigma subunit (sigma70/sigma32)
VTTFPDDHLWAAYDAAVAAGDAVKIAVAADDIIRRHLPFFVQYAGQTAFRQWNAATRDDYLAELLAVAVSKLPTYSRTMEHERGRAQFVTYVKPYLKMVRYKVEGSRGPVRLGHETVRLASDARRFIATEMAAGRPVPSNEQVADYLRERCGKPVSPERVPRLLSLPRPVGMTVPDGDGGEMTLSEAETATQYEVAEPTDPADIVADLDERLRTVERVRDAIWELGLDLVEEAVLLERLMAETPRSVESIAIEHGITEMEVKDVEADLRVRLRQLLS